MSSSARALQNLRVALIHHWLVRMRGGEKVLEALCLIFPQADIYTVVFDPSGISDVIKQHRIVSSWIQKLPGATRYYTHYLPLFPVALEHFDLSRYDLVISSEAGVGKGVITRPEACHICYCHSPMRYAWSAYHTYLQAVRNPWKRKLMPFIMNYLRMWDVTSSLKVDYFLANSQTVADRIRKYYCRDATVIYPPVATSELCIAPNPLGYFLAVGHLVPYKRFDLAVEAFNQLGHPLWVLGEGPEYRTLKKKARGNIKFLGRASDEELRNTLSHCRALISPGEEDFGMIVVEAHACGRPVIALDKGGARETVIPEVNGVLFGEETVPSLMGAVRHFESIESKFQPELVRESAHPFGEGRFQREMVRFVSEKLEEHHSRFKVRSHKCRLEDWDERG
jgi:glycosyltransferase involved in cell wall biosynthesis